MYHAFACRERCRDNEQKQKFNEKCSTKAETEITDSDSTKNAAVYLRPDGHDYQCAGTHINDIPSTSNT